MIGCPDELFDDDADLIIMIIITIIIIFIIIAIKKFSTKNTAAYAVCLNGIYINNSISNVQISNMK